EVLRHFEVRFLPNAQVGGREHRRGQTPVLRFRRVRLAEVIGRQARKDYVAVFALVDVRYARVHARFNRSRGLQELADGVDRVRVIRSKDDVERDRYFLAKLVKSVGDDLRFHVFQRATGELRVVRKNVAEGRRGSLQGVGGREQ